MLINKELSKAIRKGARLTHIELKRQNDAGAILALAIALAALVIVVAVFLNAHVGLISI